MAVSGDTWQDGARKTFVAPHQRSLGYVIQEAALFPHLDVRGNLDYGLKRTAPGRRRIPLDQVIELLGISRGVSDRVLKEGKAQRGMSVSAPR